MDWVRKEIAPETVKETAARYGVDLLSAAIMARRGLAAPEEARWFVEEGLRHLHNPFLLDGMEDAVDRMLQALDEGEKILVFGDRDTDGVTSTALMVEGLRTLGADVSWRVPRADEPYGLTVAALDEFAASGGTLVLTVDCGISNHEEGERALELGIDLVILDHHNLQAPEPPEAVAVVDPKLPGSGYPFRDLAGVGVAWKALRALAFARSGFYKQDIALLNVRPAADSFIVEAVRLRNLVEIGRVTETIVPGMVDLSRTRLVPFLEGRQIFVWDGALQKRLLSKVFGSGAEVHFYDAAPEIGEAIPAARGSSLVRLAGMSRLARYSGAEVGELDVFENLFVGWVLARALPDSGADRAALQLAAIGTVADMMPLRNENRILVREGLAALADAPRPGLAELVGKLNLAKRKLSANEISWQLTPVINAAGRMGRPELAVELLLAEDARRRVELADQVIALNEERKALGAAAWEAVRPDAEASLQAHGGKLVLVGRDDVHRGITGIIASRLSAAFKATAVMVAFLPTGIAVGSIRSKTGFDVKGLLESSAELFIDYGGHDAAAGFSLPREKWDEFVARTARFVEGVELEAAPAEETLAVDAELPHEYLRPELLDLVDRFEPFGEKNPKLVFVARNVPIAAIDIVGKRESSHLKLTLDFGKHPFPALWWNAAEKLGREFEREDRLDVAFNVQRNWWNGSATAQLVVLDARRAGSSE
ncbi:MAG: single-stranded-DNA-specific exonuclease RecJ [Spirochaetales bacterium]|nr:single-stranded-DNA-specific exonuclease RecJ [Spirochaetales bacterium]